MLQQLALLEGLRLAVGPAPTGCTPSSRRASSASPTARRTTATPASRLRWTSCSARATRTQRRALIGRAGLAASCGPARRAAASRSCRPRAPVVDRGGRSTAANASASRPRRHLPPRRRRPPRQPRLRHAERRLAALLARRSPGSASASARAAQMFWLEEGLPLLEPGGRPRTTLSPSLALRDGERWMSYGTPGGDQQDQWSLQLLLERGRPGPEPPGGDRRPGLHVLALPLELSTRATPRPAGSRSSPAGATRSSPTSLAAATTSRSPAPGRRGVSRR